MGQAGSRSFDHTRFDLLTQTQRGIGDRLRIEQDQRRVGREIVENSFKTGVKEWLEEIDSLKVDRIVQIIQYQATAVGRNIEIITELFQARSDLFQHLVRQQHLPRGKQHQLFNRLQRALRQGIKGAYGFGRIAKELYSDRSWQIGRKDIQNPPPHCKSTTILNQRHIGVAHPDETGQQIVPLKLFSGKQVTG